MADIVSRKVGEQVTVCGFEAGDKVVCTAQAVNGAGPSSMSRPYIHYTDVKGMYAETLIPECSIHLSLRPRCHDEVYYSVHTCSHVYMQIVQSGMVHVVC